MEPNLVLEKLAENWGIVSKLRCRPTNLISAPYQKTTSQQEISAESKGMIVRGLEIWARFDLLPALLLYPLPQTFISSPSELNWPIYRNMIDGILPGLSFQSMRSEFFRSLHWWRVMMLRYTNRSQELVMDNDCLASDFFPCLHVTRIKI